MSECKLKTINLKNYYPYYTSDFFIELPEEIVAATEEAGLHIGLERGRGERRIVCINTAFAEFKRVGAELYKEALAILLDAWNGEGASLRAEVM